MPSLSVCLRMERALFPVDFRCLGGSGKGQPVAEYVRQEVRVGKTGSSGR